VVGTVGASAGGSPALPELAGVWWRKRASDQTLNRAGRLWTLTALAYSVPFLAAAVAMAAVKPVMIPISVVLVVHAWVIPELYAARGAGVVKPRPGRADDPAEHAALGLLGDLLGHRTRELYARTGLVFEPGVLGVWLVAEAGALLVRPGGRRVHCYCVRVTEPALPSSDRISHLLLALREDESGFATVANLTFAGAPWRLRRRLTPPSREALAAGVAEARKPSR
jgi:hypothetical protein